MVSSLSANNLSFKHEEAQVGCTGGAKTQKDQTEAASELADPFPFVYKNQK